MIRSIFTWAFAPLFLIIGFSMTLAGGVAATMVGPDDTMFLSRYVVPDSGSVLTADLVSTGGPGAVGQVTYGTYHLSLTHAPADVFIGIAAADRVDRYLNGAAVENAGIVIPLLSTLHEEGAGRLPAVPERADIWVGLAPRTIHGATRLDWDIRRGSFTALATSPSGAGLAGATLQISVSVPGAFVSTLAVALVGTLISAGCLLAIILTLRRYSRRSA